MDIDVLSYVDGERVCISIRVFHERELFTPYVERYFKGTFFANKRSFRISFDVRSIRYSGEIPTITSSKS